MAKPENVDFLAQKLQATFEFAVPFQEGPPAFEWARRHEAWERRVVGTHARIVSASNSMALRTVQTSVSGRLMTFNLSTDESASKSLAELEKKVPRSVCIELIFTLAMPPASPHARLDTAAPLCVASSRAA